MATSKLEFREFDVRDAALHMAFVLDEIKDKARTYDININGSRNIFHSCLDAGVPWLFRSKVALQVKGHDSLAQYIHEDDLASAIRLVLQKRAHSIYHITSDDSMRVSEMMRRTGMRAPEVPRKFLERFADVGFALGFAPVSGHWIRMFSESMVGSSDRLKALGSKPTWTTEELFNEYIVKPK